MRNIRLVSQHAAIKSLIEHTFAATQRDIELQGHWGKYLCVLVYGLLENSIKEIYGDFANNSSSPQVAKYVRARLNRIRNANSQQFIQTANDFSEEWGRSLTEYLDCDSGQRKNAINSIVKQRNQIAHGQNTTISVARVKGYLEKSVEVIDFIESQCSGN